MYQPKWRSNLEIWLEQQLPNQKKFAAAAPAPSKPTQPEVSSSKLSFRHQQVLAVVRRYPGSTAKELAAMLYRDNPDGEPAFIIEEPHKRLPELERMGLVEPGPRRKCSQTNRLAHTWSPAHAR